MSDILLKNYVEQGKERLLQQFKDQPNIEAILESFLGGLDSTREAAMAVLAFMDIDNVDGAILDILGKIVGETRKGNTDSTYRENIKIRIFLNSSKGTPDELLEILDLLTDSTKIQMYEHFPNFKTFYCNSSSMSVAIPRALDSASVVTSHKTGIIHSEDDNAFIPSELEVGGAILVDRDNRDIVTETNLNIALNYLTFIAGENSPNAILPEEDETTNIRILPEYYTG